MSPPTRLGGARIGQGTITNKDIRKLVNAALAGGWTHRITGGNHVRLICPCGRHATTVAGSASDQRAIRQARHDLSCRSRP